MLKAPTIHVQLCHPGWKRVLRPHGKTVRDVCAAALSHTRIRAYDASFEMTLLLADDATIQPLNRDYRGQDKPTNVLAFPSGDVPKTRKRLPPAVYLGDVILAYETLMQEAQAQRKDPRHHALHLLVHGTLHLLGYDHQQEQEAHGMETLEIKILKRLGVANPYQDA